MELDQHLENNILKVNETEFTEKRHRSSSMDILAEAVISVTCSTLSGQTSCASEDWDDEGELKKDNPNNIDELSFSRLKRPRGATFSYSPFTSKVPDLVFSPNSGDKFMTLNWIANFKEDEHTTADLLSNLSQFKTQYKSPSSDSKFKLMPDLGFGNNFYKDNNLQDGDISILTDVVNKFFDCEHIENDEDEYDIPLQTEYFNGRARSNSMPELSMKMKYNLNATSNEYIVKHGLAEISDADIYTPEERKKRIEKFLEKRRNRIWTKKVKYDVRKNFADSRIRVKGRFIRKQEEEILLLDDK